MCLLLIEVSRDDITKMQLISSIIKTISKLYSLNHIFFFYSDNVI